MVIGSICESVRIASILTTSCLTRFYYYFLLLAVFGDIYIKGRALVYDRQFVFSPLPTVARRVHRTPVTYNCSALFDVRRHLLSVVYSSDTVSPPTAVTAYFAASTDIIRSLIYIVPGIEYTMSKRTCLCSSFKNINRLRYFPVHPVILFIIIHVFPLIPVSVDFSTIHFSVLCTHGLRGSA